jgi:hypothetical protein
MNKNLLSCFILLILTTIGITIGVMGLFYSSAISKEEIFYYLYAVSFGGIFTAYYQYDTYSQSKNRKKW